MLVGRLVVAAVRRGWDGERVRTEEEGVWRWEREAVAEAKGSCGRGEADAEGEVDRKGSVTRAPEGVEG